MKRIIIVEDDPMIMEIYHKKFSDSGFEVLTANGGEGALSLAEKEKTDAILLDLIMPKMDGFEVVKKLREGICGPETKIIIFSNLSQREDRDKAMKLGADGFIIKSDYSPTELVKEVERLLGQFEEQEHNEEIRAQGSNRTTSGKRILLVEDEEVFIEMFGEKLKQEGYSLVSAKNGGWGLKEAMNGDFDLFIIDMVMPAMGGEEIIKRLKMEEKTKNIPIVVLSASVSDEATKRVEEIGIEAFFVKTQITPSELAKKIQEILNNNKE